LAAIPTAIEHCQSLAPNLDKHGTIADVSGRVRRTNGIEIALELHALAEAMLRQRLRRSHPTWTRASIEAEVAKWRVARPGAEHGDAVGRPGTWPRRARR
jgi:hypothetical protein